MIPVSNQNRPRKRRGQASDIINIWTVIAWHAHPVFPLPGRSSTYNLVLETDHGLGERYGVNDFAATQHQIK
jgi:hypothetical protein